MTPEAMADTVLVSPCCRQPLMFERDQPNFVPYCASCELDWPLVALFGRDALQAALAEVEHAH